MLSSDEEDYDVFFDSADRLSSEGLAFADEELGCSNLDYQIWVSEPQSVKERRECFLRGMGLDEFGSLMISSKDIKTGVEVCCSSKMMGLDRVKECSGAASSSCGEEGDDKANVMCNELHGSLQEKPSMIFTQEECRQSSAEIHVECQRFHQGRKKLRNWWKRFVNKRNVRCSTVVSDESNSGTETPKRAKIQVRQNKKRCVEFTAPYIGQEIHAHKGFIWTMKFSPDGQYLASGGEDGIVRVWRVTVADATSDYLAADGNFCSRLKDGKSSFRRKHSIHASVVFPDKVFQIDESPLQEFHGHSSDVLDLAWSNSNCLLSSSKDKTVRQWQVGCDQCLNVFHHNNYVTCIQFNPIDDNYFISGSIDGKVRIWGLYEKRVVDWADVRDVITAICYRPDGEGFVVGSITGTCRFYEASGECLLLDAQIHIPGRKKTAGNKITGIKFSQDRIQRVMISSEDSKLRIFDGVDLVHKYKGLPKSGSQMSASFTSSGRHIISVGEDSRVYVWNYNELSVSSSKQTKSVRSCEHFFHEGVSVAIPWSGMGTEQGSLASDASQYSSQAHDYLERSSWIRDSDRFSLGNWFSMDGSCRGSVTWPEEKLPLWDISVVEDQNHLQETPQHLHDKAQTNTALSETWGLVIVTGGWDGTIRIFHNYGLPVRL